MGVKVEPFDGGDCLVGDRASLSAHPNCPPGMFDGEGVTWKTTRTLMLPDGRQARVSRIGRRYRLCVPVTAAEWETLLARRKQVKATKLAIEKAKTELSALPNSAADFRARAARDLSFWRGPFRALADGTFGTLRGGYMLDTEARDSVAYHLRAIAAIFETGRVVFDAARHQAVIDEVMAPARDADPSFAKMLASITAGGQQGSE
jgi:hypothetical protein